MNGNDFAKAIGINKPANVKDKIKRWQQEVEPDSTTSTTPTANDAPGPSTPEAAPKHQQPPPTTPKTTAIDHDKPRWKPAHTPKKSVDVSPERPDSAKKTPVAVAHNVLDEEVLTATAPKKRVISDSHWRNKQSPPKENARPAPKVIANAWVRPSRVIKNDPRGDIPEPPELKPPEKPAAKSPQPLTPPLVALVSYVGRSTGQQKKQPQKQRRPSKAADDARPASNGSGSAEEVRSDGNAPAAPTSPKQPKEKAEMIKMRRRPRARTSPRGSLSADDAAPSLGRRQARKSDSSILDDGGNVVTVEYDEPSTITSPRDDEIRERRRRRRPRSQGDGTADESPRQPQAAGRRRRRRSSPKAVAEKASSPEPEPEPAAAVSPNKVFATRLDAWLSTTPDPFTDKNSRRRRSADSVSTLDLPSKTNKSEVTVSTDTTDEPAEEETPPSAGSGSGSRRRRRRRRSQEIKIDTKLADEPATVVSESTVETVSTDTSTEVSTEVSASTDLTPTPTLKRRGARRSQHSPTKSRSMSSPLRETTSIDDALAAEKESAVSTAPSSSVSSQPIEIERVPIRGPRPLATQRLFPSTGKRLSTIASVDSFTTKAKAAPPSTANGSDFITIQEEPSSDVASQFRPETSTIVSRRSTRRKRLASHADLISVLSMPKAAGTKSIVSARSIRTNRSRLATATIGDIMRELASDESKYMRELRTLVDGVIPVLLSCVLSKSDSAVAAGLFSRSAKGDPNVVTQPIVDMGVCLERLKTLHKRVPREESDAFLSWAKSAHLVYADYISAWRLGFQDVVISLAPADDDPFKPAKIVEGPDDGAPWDEGMPRNAEGYVVNGDGERVDVAYMLKRPLVRLKYLAKSLKGVNHVKPSERAENISSTFQDLVAAARKRSNDEHARLEDEAAASIDATRARDPRSLAPLAGVRIAADRCVRARDHFDLHLYHSTGQEISCRVEILLRDDVSSQAGSGDLLVCEVDPTGRWLLLPPIQQDLVSARNGDLQGEIIVMIRGVQSDGAEWSEVMSLVIDDEQAGFDWVHMLGLKPIPPQISDIQRGQTTSTQTARPSNSHASSSLLSTGATSKPPHKSRTPSPHEIEIPIGEQHTRVSKVWRYDTPEKKQQSQAGSSSTPLNEAQPRKAKAPNQLRASTPEMDTTLDSTTMEDMEQTPRTLNEAIRMAENQSPSGLRRTTAKRQSKTPASSSTHRPSRQITLDDPSEAEEDANSARQLARSPRRKSTRRQRPQSVPSAPSTISQSSKGFSVWMPGSDVEYSDESEEEEHAVEESQESPPGSPPSPQRPSAHRRVSSVPSLELPSIPRLRKTSQPTTPTKSDEEEPKKAHEPPASAPPAVRVKSTKRRKAKAPENADEPPPVPEHRSPSSTPPVTLRGSNTPVFTPSLPAFKNKRRSSSPLKHEYEPSTCTESSSSSEEELASDEDIEDEAEASQTSESSEDELDDDVPMPLMPIGYPGPRGYAARPSSAGRDNARFSRNQGDVEDVKKFPKVSPPSSIYTLPNGTITPSQSASNTPYRTVPQGAGKATKAVASIFAWSDAGRWDSLHPDECSIVVTPGKIEVFEISAMHSKPFVADGDEIIQPEGRAPLVAVELTPLVPLRKSTAIDISIRSPPTAESRIKSGNNIMLRSRNATECAQLYAMINQSRINNPTYIALQNARGPYGQTSWAEAMDRQNAARTASGGSSGWLGGTLGRRSSYRKTSTRAASISAATDSSVGTMNSALRSALGRFSFGKNGIFSIRNSTLGSRSTGSSMDAADSGGSGASTPNGDGRAPGAPAGITNTKCRLYERESLKKWRDMGGARLTIMLPSPNPTAPGSPLPASRQRAPGTRDITQERRILVTSKSKGETLLDVTLSESCFERVARSGIAVSVWEDIVDETGRIGGVAKTGGVSGARARVFMLQMKTERECAYVYGLLGKQRY